MKLIRFTTLFTMLTVAAFLPAQAGLTDWFTQKAQNYPNESTAVLWGSMFAVMGWCKYRYDQLDVHRARVGDIPCNPRSAQSKLTFTTPDLNREDLLKEIKAVKEKFVSQKNKSNRHREQFSLAASGDELKLISEFDSGCAKFDTYCYTRSGNAKLKNAETILNFVKILNNKATNKRSLNEYDKTLDKAIAFMETLEYHCDFEALDQNQDGLVAIATITGLATLLGTLYINYL